jgi:hypothetical protein
MANTSIFEDEKVWKWVERVEKKKKRIWTTRRWCNDVSLASHHKAFNTNQRKLMT